MSSPLIPFEKKKKRNHDFAYLLIMLGLFFGAFIFVMLTVNYLLRSLPIP
jgi:F0F1-type ATP synthase membrane subunit a